MYSDPIADLLTRIRNGYRASKSEVSIPYSKHKEAIVRVLQQYRFVQGVTSKTEGTHKDLVVALRYSGPDDKIPALSHIKRISLPSRRVYQKAAEIKRVLQGFGIAILSTPQGVMSDIEARKRKLGGEVICEVW